MSPTLKSTQHAGRNNLQPSLVLAILILMSLLVSVGAVPSNQATLSYSEINGWGIKAGTVEGGIYRLQTSPSVSNSWQWTGDEMIASKAELEFPVVVSPDTDPRRFWRVARLIHKIAFVGDSITDSTSGYPNYWAPVGMPSYMHRSYSGYAAAILGQAFTSTTNSYSFLGPTLPDWDFGWGGIRADRYLTDTVNSRSSGGNQYPGVTLTPAQAAIASNPDAYVVLIGTNDIPSASAPVVTERIAAVLDVLRATGKLVFCGTLLPRIGDTAAPTVEPIQTRIDAVNAALPAICEERDVTLVSWHEALMTGNQQNPVYFPDGIHPNSGGSAVMGSILAKALRPYMASEFPLPPKGDSRWASSNPYMDIDSDANGRADGFSFNYFSSSAFSLETVDGEVWQRCTEPENIQSSAQIIYPPAVLPARRDALAESQIPLRVACRYEILSGDVGAIGLLVKCQNGSEVNLYTGYYRPANYDGPLVPHQGLMMTGKFVIPPGTTQFSVSLVNYGGVDLRIRQYGVFEDP